MIRAGGPTFAVRGARIMAGSVAILGMHASAAPEAATLRDPWTLPAMAGLFFDFVAAGRMDVDALASHRFTPYQAPDVCEALRRDRSGYLGVFLDWTGVDV